MKILYTASVCSKLEYASFICSPYYTCLAAGIERIQKLFLHFALRNLWLSDPIPTLIIGLESTRCSQGWPSKNILDKKWRPMMMMIPTYEVRWFLIKLKSLQNRRIMLSSSFIFDFIRGAVDCPVLLESICFNILTRAPHSWAFFYVGVSKSHMLLLLEP